jgi:membrane dipeptidase
MNEYIESCWQAGVDCLKPSKQDLDRGTELHRDALVFELYGFAPRLVADVDLINNAIDSGDPPSDLDDMIRACRTITYADNPALRDEYRKAWDFAGVDSLVFCTVGIDRSPLVLLRQFAWQIHANDQLRDTVMTITRPDDVLEAKRIGKRGIVLGSCDVPITGDGATVAQELRFIATMYQFLGRAAVAEMNRFGIMVDVAHCGHQTSYDAAKASSQPIVASHTGATALNDHPRCKPDHVLKAIADGGGLIGVVSLPEFVGRSGDLSAVLDHIDYIVNLVGPDHVAIGMDRGYEHPDIGAAIRRIKGKPPKALHSLWQPGSLGADKWRKPGMLESTTWTNFPLITVGLVQRGYNEQDIRKILGENTLRYWKTIWHEAAPPF